MSDEKTYWFVVYCFSTNNNMYYGNTIVKTNNLFLPVQETTDSLIVKHRTKIIITNFIKVSRESYEEFHN